MRPLYNNRQLKGIVERYELGRSVDRWLTHRDEQMSFKYTKPEEEIRVRVVTPRVSSLL